MPLCQLHGLLFPGELSPLIQRRRALLIVSRTRLVASLFAVLTPLWIPVDLYVFPSRLAVFFAGLRIFAALAFTTLAIICRPDRPRLSPRWALAGLLAVPVIFFLISEPLLAGFDMGGQLAQVMAAGYAFLPFVMVAGLSMFPITAVEGGMLSVPLLIANLVVGFLGYRVMPFDSHLGAMWLLALLSVVATLAGMSQLHFMQQLIAQASHDVLTKAYSRRVGEELLELQFHMSRRAGSPFSLIFLDIDDFKMINDRFGHEEGDDALRQVGSALRHILRRADLLIRWGGEEFVVVMPDTGLQGAHSALQRLLEAGLGQRPDGSRMTASIGVAERITDACLTWADLVGKADRRMYAAKQAGKGCIVLTGETIAA